METTTPQAIEFPETLKKQQLGNFVPNPTTLTALLDMGSRDAVVINEEPYENVRGFKFTENMFRFAPVNPKANAPRINVHSESSIGSGEGIPSKIWDVDIVQQEPMQNGEIATVCNTYSPDGSLFSEKRSLTMNNPKDLAKLNPQTQYFPFTTFTLEKRNKVNYLRIGLTDNLQDLEQSVVVEFVLAENGALVPTNTDQIISEVYTREASLIVPVLNY